ncbi:uncharacterized protein NMK_1627 [Novimethylophilus kurashikiensis]|uniref:FecR protein domain-containing protein n=1 Tax=Novimethylophilus kurashikiensis TaxID=1825523 RepID=A0A2R5F956_9PROT|nr:FecR domain-containing protein [Novimethylophilus kurashikiensis]GBG14068.1 uncharacterized protein NMK_1627 [Novimethylophilus kurashikiensis]
MKRLITAFLLFLASMAATANDEVIGYVKTVTGSAAVTHAGTPIQAVPGTPLYMKDALKTASNGAMGVTFKDNTVMSFGPNTEITIDEFLYAPSKEQLSLSAKINKGTMEYVSGVIAKLKPQAVAIKTPTGTIGVRGTHFMVKVDDLSESPSDDANESAKAVEGADTPNAEEQSMNNPQTPQE